jgi:hypothetical protein
MPYMPVAPDLPPALASLLNVGQTPMYDPGPGGIDTAAMGSRAMPSYQVGGMVGPGGTPIRPGVGGGAPGLAAPGAMQQSLSPEQIPGEVQRFVQQNPQQVQQMKSAIQNLIQTGQVSMEDMNMIVQMAQAAAQNPSLYPQLRKLAIQRGLADASTISEQFDSGLIFTLLLLGAVLQSGGMSQQSTMPAFKKGGALPEKVNSVDGAVVAKLHEGEYVIPAHIVRAKGTEFFDKMLEGYSGEKPAS